MRLAENIWINSLGCLWPDAQMFLRMSEIVLGFSLWQMKLFRLILSWMSPQDSKRFDSIDTDFKELTYAASKTPNVVEATNKPGLYDKLEDIQCRSVFVWFTQLPLCNFKELFTATVII